MKAAQGLGEEQLSTQIAEITAMIDLLGILPHSTQAQFIGGNFGVWCSLDADSLVGLATDLVLKHGSHVPGEWHMLGILDALPGVEPETGSITTLSKLEQDIVTIAGSLIGRVAAHFAPMTRKLLGRPNNAFGATPLLIYRDVSG